MTQPHHVHPVKSQRATGRLRRRLVGIMLVAIGLGGIAVGAAVLSGFLPNPTVAGDPKASGHGMGKATGPMTVKVVRPKRDPNFRITTLVPVAVVEPYYQADLRARVAGEILYVAKDIGEEVKAGELLLEIDVPDLRQAVEQKEAIIAQRQRELIAAEADLAVARSALDAARVAVRVKGLEVNRAKDLRAARKIDLDQVTELFSRGSVVRARVDAAELDYHAAERAVEAAEVDVEKARVEESGKAASSARAQADVELKRALVEVARKDRDAAAIHLSYSQLHAPFAGVIIARDADPGRFVSGSVNSASEPLVTVARTDLVTVAIKVPDNAAAYISLDTEASIEFTQLPGVSARGPITRLSPNIDPADQTMRVEVDVFNGSHDEYQMALHRAVVPLTVAPIVPFDRMTGFIAGGGALLRYKRDLKGWHEGAALVPDWGPESRYRTIVPGSTATVRLDLEKFSNAFLLPSSAIFSKSGQSYILVVQNDITRAVPVAVQVNDGKLVKVATITPRGTRQVTQELTGDEIVVATRQLEVGEGTRVNAVLHEW